MSDFCEIRDDGLVNENIYRFVWSNSLTEYSELVDDCCITMKFVEDSETDVNAYMYITGSWVLTSYVYKEYKTLPMGYFSQWLRENPNIVEIRREISYALAKPGTLKKVSYTNGEYDIKNTRFYASDTVTETENEEYNERQAEAVLKLIKK